MARNYRSGAAWLPGVIVQQLGPLTYLVDVSEGCLWKRHVDHIKDLHARPTENETWPEPQVGGSSEATETSPSLPDLSLPVVEPTEVPTSVPVPRSPPNKVPVPVPESHGSPTSASSSRVIAPPSTPSRGSPTSASSSRVIAPLSTPSHGSPTSASSSRVIAPPSTPSHGSPTSASSSRVIAPPSTLSATRPSQKHVGLCLSLANPKVTSCLCSSPPRKECK